MRPQGFESQAAPASLSQTESVVTGDRRCLIRCRDGASAAGGRRSNKSIRGVPGLWLERLPARLGARRGNAGPISSLAPPLLLHFVSEGQLWASVNERTGLGIKEWNRWVCVRGKV